MYVKLFTQILDSSLADDRKLRHFFTDLLLCADPKGYVVMTTNAIARKINAPEEEVVEGIRRLCEPDPCSKTPDCDGRRIEPLEGMGYGWRIVNYEAYRAMKDADQMREATKERVRRYRERKRMLTSGNASNVGVTLGNANTEEEAEENPPNPQRGDSAKADEGKVKEKKQKVKPSERGVKFAEWFHSELPQGVNVAPSWREQWARCYDDMIRLDQRTPDQVSAVCKWLRKSSMWSPNIQSPLKLRQRDRSGIMYFDVVASRMKSEVQPQPQNAAHVIKPIRRAILD